METAVKTFALILATVLLGVSSIPALAGSAAEDGRALIERRKQERAARREREQIRREERARRDKLELVGETSTAVNRWGQSISFCYRSTYETPIRVQVTFLRDRYVLPAKARPDTIECATISVRKFGQGKIQLERVR